MIESDHWRLHIANGFSEEWHLDRQTLIGVAIPLQRFSCSGTEQQLNVPSFTGVHCQVAVEAGHQNTQQPWLSRRVRQG